MYEVHAERSMSRPPPVSCLRHIVARACQFLTSGKAKFLAQPVYGRDFPPSKYCE